MTLCIAAQSQDQCIVAVSDKMLSIGFKAQATPGVDDATEKDFVLGKGWYGMYAGNAFLARSIIVAVQQMLTPSRGRLSRERVERALRTAQRKKLREGIETSILARFNLSWDLARKDPAIRQKIERYALPLSEFLIFGVDAEKRRHFFHFSTRGFVADCAELGHWAIGIGAPTAFGVLATRNLRNLFAPELLYRLCEAKFSCETVDSIGRETSLMVVSPLGELIFIRPQYIEQLRAIWERERTTAPKDAISVARQAILVDPWE